MIDEDIFGIEGILKDTIDSIVNEIEKEVDIITFCESPTYLNQKLHAVEKFILKIFYEVPLDDKTKDIHVRSFPHNEKGVLMTEVEYAKFLRMQERTNVLDPYNFQTSMYLLLICGRRSGKTFLASIVSSFEAYKLIVKGNPQQYYHLPEGETINIINVATNGEQALILAEATKKRIINSEWFKPYIASMKQSTIRLRTKRDLDLFNKMKRNLKADSENKDKEDKADDDDRIKENDTFVSIIIEAMSCTARGIRGKTVIVAILDEIAHFIDNGGNKSGDEVFKAITPSISTFNTDGKILCISSPYNKIGIFYDLYLKSKGTETIPPNQEIRMFQIPTWEMNEVITFNYLKGQYDIDPESFEFEYGAQFSTTITGFFKFPEKIDECIDEQWIEKQYPRKKYLHYIAIDPASVRAGYALCMVHIEEELNEETNEYEKIVVVDRWKRWLANVGEFEGEDLIDPSVIDEYILNLTKRFRIAKVVYDQFESASSIHKLRRAGITAERQPFSSAYNMKIYKRLRQFVYNNKVVLPKYSDGINELKYLQERKTGRKGFIVEAPSQGEIVTDDLADVLANATFISTESEITKGTSQIVGTSGNGGSKITASDTNNVKSFSGYKRRLASHGSVDKMALASQYSRLRR